MKARIGKTSHGSVNTVQQELLDNYVVSRWREYGSDQSACIFYALALALNDLYGRKENGIMRVLNAIGEIIEGYNEMVFSIKERRDGFGDVKKLAQTMNDELIKRGIHIEF